MSSVKEKILHFMREEVYRPVTAEDLAAEMDIKGGQLGDFWEALDELESTAEVIKTRYGTYGVPERMNLVVGRFDSHRKGFGFVVPENPEEADVYVPSDSTMTAMHNDRVVVRIHHHQRQDGKREGKIIRIIQRANKRVVGTFEGSKHYGFVTPDDHRLGQDIFIPKDEFNGAKNGYKVVVELVNWPEKRKSAEGKVVEVLGKKGDTGIEILSIIKNFNLPVDFPEEVERESQAAPSSINEAEINGRRDLRHLPIVTIDGEDAKDLDDAVYVERLKNGHYMLGVHIADVSYYVRENTALDKEARERGTSVYLVDRVLPMLPRRLSNGICSLNAGEDRLAMSIHMEIDHQGKVQKYEIFPSVIRVKKRLTYTLVRKILADHDEELRKENADLVPELERMEQLCRILRERRMRRGAIDFDFPEVKVKLDEQGRPVDIIKRIRSIAESVIEEFMLVANETVAEHMNLLGIPFMYRVHEEPDPQKMIKLNILLNNFGQQLVLGGEVQPMALQQILRSIAGRPEERIISTVMLRSLRQARYEAENLGHFGLAAKYYTHFTSPIRRYPDLIVHRLLRETFTTGEVSAKRRNKLAKMLPDIALHSSQRERQAAEAEMATTALKKVEYMTGFIGEDFDGVISGVTTFGIFVELDNGIEGLVHVSAMDDDYYHYSEEQYALIGERTRKIYRLGSPVRVKVVKTNVEERSIDFVLVKGSSATAVEKAPRVRPAEKVTRKAIKKEDKPKRTRK